MKKQTTWSRFKSCYLKHEKLDFALDISRVNFPDTWLSSFESKFKNAHLAIKQLEKGKIANPDEERMVGHYWLRNSDKAPNAELKQVIESSKRDIKNFTSGVLSGKIKGQKGKFQNLLLVGIGGSALGPQFIYQALRPAKNGLQTYFLDNTDADGIDRTLNELKTQLGKTLVVVISKSGGTKETRNAMLEVMQAYKKAKLIFNKHAVAITGEGSKLDNMAVEQSWIKRFDMWDWVGGRTSVMSAVGLLPMALAGFDIKSFLDGGKQMDEWTRQAKLKKNPAGLLAAMWYFIGDGKGKKDMVILPYKDRLELFSKYLQQLVMESLGKEKDLNGKKVNQGIAVYGNKGSTDQHAYIQQLRDGLDNFFATFIEVKKGRDGASMEVDLKMTTSDYLEGFYLGTRKALSDKGRHNITVTIDKVDAFNVGMLIALFERAVSLYAVYVNINAYHQPGVEAGKKAAQEVLDLKVEVQRVLKASKKAMTAESLAKKMGLTNETETIFKLLDYMSANRGSGVILQGASVGFKSLYKAN